MIQSHLSIQLPCYDFTPVIAPTFIKRGNKSALRKIENALKPMDELKLNVVPASTDVDRVKKVLNRF